jgi:hypothetical protein
VEGFQNVPGLYGCGCGFAPDAGLHKEACSRINKKAKVDFVIVGTATATGVLVPVTAPVAETVAAAEALVGGVEEGYMAFFCE